MVQNGKSRQTRRDRKGSCLFLSFLHHSIFEQESSCDWIHWPLLWIHVFVTPSYFLHMPCHPLLFPFFGVLPPFFFHFLAYYPLPIAIFILFLYFSLNFECLTLILFLSFFHFLSFLFWGCLNIGFFTEMNCIWKFWKSELDITQKKN